MSDDRKTPIRSSWFDDFDDAEEELASSSDSEEDITQGGFFSYLRPKGKKKKKKKAGSLSEYWGDRFGGFGSWFGGYKSSRPENLSAKIDALAAVRRVGKIIFEGGAAFSFYHEGAGRGVTLDKKLLEDESLGWSKARRVDACMGNALAEASIQKHCLNPFSAHTSAAGRRVAAKTGRESDHLGDIAAQLMRAANWIYGTRQVTDSFPGYAGYFSAEREFRHNDKAKETFTQKMQECLLQGNFFAAASIAAMWNTLAPDNPIDSPFAESDEAASLLRDGALAAKTAQDVPKAVEQALEILSRIQQPPPQGGGSGEGEEEEESDASDDQQQQQRQKSKGAKSNSQEKNEKGASGSQDDATEDDEEDENESEGGEGENDDEGEDEDGDSDSGDGGDSEGDDADDSEDGDDGEGDGEGDSDERDGDRSDSRSSGGGPGGGVGPAYDGTEDSRTTEEILEELTQALGLDPTQKAADDAAGQIENYVEREYTEEEGHGLLKGALQFNGGQVKLVSIWATPEAAIYNTQRRFIAPYVQRVREKLSFRNEIASLDERGLRRGMVDEGSISNVAFGARDVFRRQDIISSPSVHVGILIDQSGSMSSQVAGYGSLDGYQIAQQTAILLHEACKNLAGVRVSIWGHNTVGQYNTEGPTVYRYLEAGRGDALNLGSIRPGGGNADGFCIAYCGKRLQELSQPEEQRILFVLADGAPAAHLQIHGRWVDYLDPVGSGGRHTRDQVNALRRSGTQVFLLGMGNAFKARAGEAMFGKDGYQIVQNMQDVPKAMGRLLEKVLRSGHA